MITLDAHARDVVAMLNRNGVVDASNFQVSVRMRAPVCVDFLFGIPSIRFAMLLRHREFISKWLETKKHRTEKTKGEETLKFSWVLLHCWLFFFTFNSYQRSGSLS
jgi:hypothetical protein